MCKECEEKLHNEKKEGLKTKVCKTCGIEKPLNEFSGREKGYYRPSCKVCMYIKKHNILADDKFTLNEYHTIIDCLLNYKINYVNDIISKLNNKSLDDLLDAFEYKITIPHVPLKVKQKCLNCDDDTIMKPYEYKNKLKKFCCFQCSVEYNNTNGTWGAKSNETMEWFGSKEEFINTYKLLGLNESARHYNKSEHTIDYWAKKYGITSRQDILNDLTKEDIIKIYKMVLDGRLKSGFPNGFSKNNSYVKELVRHLINNILKWNREDICNNFKGKLFVEYKLDSIIGDKLNYEEIFNLAFPEYQLFLWEFKQYDKLIYKYWNINDNIIKAKTWLKNKLKEDKNITKPSDFINYNLRELMHEYNLHSLCIKIYNYNVQKFLSEIYNCEVIENKEMIINKSCNCCHKSKPFTKKYYAFGVKFNLFKLSYICKECIENRDRRNFYAEKGIIYTNTEEDIDILQWYEYYINNKISMMPKICYSRDNLKVIIRHLIIEKLNLYNKTTLCDIPIFQFLQEYKINGLKYFKTKLDILQFCFPEFSFVEDDLLTYTEDICDTIIKDWMIEKDVNIEKLLENRGIEKLYNKEMKKMMQFKKKSKETQLHVFLRYFNKYNICNPKNGLPISILDFNNKPRGFWEDKNNRIKAIQYYCEIQCEDSILNNLENHYILYNWVEKYFKKATLKKLYYFNTFKMKWYDLLIESYPIIEERKLFFEWEWVRNQNKNKEYLVQVLRDFIKYRANDLVINLEQDIPRYINHSYMRILAPKLATYVDLKIFDSYYDWCKASFPEYSWKGKDFGLCITFDGAICGSVQEQMLYEFIKRELDVKDIKTISMKRSGKYIFKLDEECEYSKLCPDFVIEYLYKDNKKIKLKKPIIIEYYGLFYLENQCDMIKNYIKKTEFKNNYYKSNNDIYFVGLYPDDLKNNFQGVREKLTSFFMSNFSI